MTIGKTHPTLVSYRGPSSSWSEIHRTSPWKIRLKVLRPGPGYSFENLGSTNLYCPSYLALTFCRTISNSDCVIFVFPQSIVLIWDPQTDSVYIKSGPGVPIASGSLILTYFLTLPEGSGHISLLHSGSILAVPWSTSLNQWSLPNTVTSVCVSLKQNGIR